MLQRWILMLTQPGPVEPEMLAHHYPGAGTADEPYRIDFLKHDPHDPMQFPPWLRWMLCCICGGATFSVAFISSSYASGVTQIAKDLGSSEGIATLGLSLFLVGFIVGPLFWAPASEWLGRRPIFVLSLGGHVALNVCLCFCPNLAAVLPLRLLSGAFGASSLTNAGAVIADTFPPQVRGLAITVYALVPLFAPILGPLVGSFVAEAWGWRALMELNALLSASAWIALLIALPETYAPVLLRLRAQHIGELTGKVCVSSMAVQPSDEPGVRLRDVLSRPIRLAVHQPILLLLAGYQAIVFGTLYMAFAAFPIVHSAGRGWSPGMSGLSILGLVGSRCSVLFQLWDHHRYARLIERLAPQHPSPEARLPGCCLGSVSLTIGLFWLAGTSSPHFHWLWSITAGIPFGFGVVLITIGSTSYLVDAYTVFAASALTVCICARAACGAFSPLLIRQAFSILSVRWALSIPATLALVCAPFPFVLYHCGPQMRSQSGLARPLKSISFQDRDQNSWPDWTPLLPQV
ncbi:MFS general substrate transporter [Aspergillus homomorphus CBS 101889]|uniref:MFS general substrate transporter n=1 Tax=Aspergillus homomorphus (strain CBS 101889) TaxID=1450537 RepID=A0A395HPM6_ASPHC|nr:MFS general substrate transporter [Aspergillus homomorphus CBS 101889]RAL09576.1 MFS general substrate transporter [Aspergillus homomorphus CBS 101889]